MNVYVEKGMEQVKTNTFRMTLYGDGDVATAKALFFPDGCFDGKKIAQGSAYCNTKTFDVCLYSEEENEWGGE